ncbi:MAG: protein kinase [Coriobacteriia bacterium]|nr:protein kinase [Coriobacteriia bacterium]
MSENFGPYEIRGRLGAGAMAVVWRAWDPKLEREVAIKEPIRAPGMSESTASELAERFVFEGKTSARLSHPGIVTIYAADVFDGRSAIVMELLRGHTLSNLIDSGRMSLPASVGVLDQLLDALDYAHTMGVVHRDIKPDNIFITEDGRVKLTDFGVAHVSRLDGVTDGVIAGTPGYMAPEQIRAEYVDGRADLFGIGVIAYEMLTGHNPFGATDGLDTTTITFRTTTTVPQPLPGALGVPADVEAVIQKAMAQDSAMRFQSAADMRYHLAQAMAGGTGGSAMLADLTGGLPASGQGVSFTTSTVEALKTKAPDKGSPSWVIAVSGVGALLLLGFLAMAAGSGGFGVMAAAVAAVGGLVWWLMSRERSNSGAPTEAEILSMGLTGNGTAECIEVHILGPHENRVEVVTIPARIGRSGDVEITVADDSVSRSHAIIERREGWLWLRDLGSRNGTQLNGTLVADAPLGIGAAVTIGETEVRVLREGL